MGTDEDLFILVPVPGHGARVLPLELVPLSDNALCPNLGMGTMFEWNCTDDRSGTSDAEGSEYMLPR